VRTVRARASPRLLQSEGATTLARGRLAGERPVLRLPMPSK